MKGIFQVSFHMGKFVFRLLRGGDGSESLIIVYLLKTNAVSLIAPGNVYLCDVY